MVKNAKVYECDICGRKETIEEGYEPNDIVHFEIYNLKPCICKRCLSFAMDACKECKGDYTDTAKRKMEERINKDFEEGGE